MSNFESFEEVAQIKNENPFYLSKEVHSCPSVSSYAVTLIRWVSWF